MQLAFIAAIQQLPPRQRAVLLLCDVLGWAAAEAATLLGGSTGFDQQRLAAGARNARQTQSQGRPTTAAGRIPLQQELLDRYLQAWEGHELAGFVALLKGDATVTMPPWLQWYAGREAIRSFIGVAWKICGGLRLVPTAANGQPAFAVYERTGADGRWAAHAIQVLTLEQGDDFRDDAIRVTCRSALVRGVGFHSSFRTRATS